MGIPVIVYGKSGSGKTRSLKEFAEDEIVFVNVEKKLPPFRKQFKYTCETDNVQVIKTWLKRMPTKIAVIDDAGYILTNTFMRGHSAGRKGSQTFDLYNDIADQYWGLFKFIKDELPKDVIIYIIMHEDTNDSGIVKLKTIGKLLDEKITIEGLFTIVLKTHVEDGKYTFFTQNSGFDTVKSPIGMFTEMQIDNDLKMVDNVIRDYYGITIEQANGKEEKKND